MDESVSRATGTPAVGDDAFDAYYFANCCGVPYRRDAHWLGFFGKIADRIAADIQPRRVLDAGCALGILVERLRELGIDAEGIDISSYAIANVHPPVQPFCRQGSIATEFSDRYDLIVSIEVLEHMPAAEGEAAIANFCRHADEVLFSSTPSDYREPSHVNVQPAEYWAEQFARHGLYRDVDFDASFITPWAVRFRRSGEPFPRIVRGYERQFALLAAARNDSRQFALDVQRDLARERERLMVLAAGSDRADEASAAIAQHRAALQATIAQLNDLAVALDHQRLALLQSREHLEQERAVLAGERAADGDARVAFEHERTAVERERTAVERERTEVERERTAVEAHRAQLEQRETREIASLRTALDETHAHLHRKVLALDASESQATALRDETVRTGHELQHARETIARMEQSVFWRLRGFWAGVSRAFGRPT